jgi:hypothetical protein
VLNTDCNVVDSAPAEQGFIAEEAGSLGEIRVELHYKQVFEQLDKPSLHYSMHDIDKISEKALKGKAISHAARYFVYYFPHVVSFLTDIQARRGSGCADPKYISCRVYLRSEQTVCYLQIQISFHRYAKYTLNYYLSIDKDSRGPQSVLHNTSFAYPDIFE